MLTRVCCLVLLLIVAPFEAHAASYQVRPGDSLSTIAQRYHVSVAALARANGIANVNFVRAGSLLIIPGASARTTRRVQYRVRWGDTLLGLAARFRTTIASIRTLNPLLGAYPLAGQRLRLCWGCSSGSRSTYRSQAPVSRTYATAGSIRYVVRPGDSLSGIAASYGTSISSLISANGIVNPNHVEVGAVLTVPSQQVSAGYDPWTARSLIASYARWYGLNVALPLAVADEESGFNQAALSPTGAVGVMQVEPYTAAHINQILGSSLNIHRIDDNIHAGIFWLASLLRYYGGDEHLAVAAYYQGTRSLARRGMYLDTVQYVNNVMALKQRFGG